MGQDFSKKENSITICAKNRTVYATYLYKQNNMITFDYVLMPTIVAVILIRLDKPKK